MIESGSSGGRRRSASSNREDELGARLLDVFRNSLYQEARESIIHFEVVEGERATDAIIEVRNAFDHLYQAANAETPGECDARLAAVHDHLRRAAVEPAQFAIETRLASVVRHLRAYSFKRLFLPERPPKAEIMRRVRAIGQMLIEGRTDKALTENVVAALGRLRAAHLAAANLDDELSSGSLALWVRVTVWACLPVVGLAVSVLALLA